MWQIAGKVLSLVVSGSVITIAYQFSGEETAFRYAMFYVLPLALIWFPKEMANFTGSLGGQPITQASHPGCVYAGGWAMLFLPVLMFVIVWVRS